jgi:hypothetical protein
MNKELLRGPYSELKGYLLEAPTDRNISNDGSARMIQKQVSECINEINTITEKDYNRFKVITVPGGSGVYIDGSGFRLNISSLINRLHGEYFAEEKNPLDGTPSTIINTHQIQSSHIELLVNLNNTLDRQIEESQNLEHKTFLEKLKKGISSLSNIQDIFKTTFKIAKDSGISIEEIQNIFS